MKLLETPPSSNSSEVLKTTTPYRPANPAFYKEEDESTEGSWSLNDTSRFVITFILGNTIYQYLIVK